MKTKSINILLLLSTLSILSACNEQSADYEVKEEKIVKDNRIITEEAAVNMLEMNQVDILENVKKIEAYRTPIFSWQKFWKLAFQDRVISNKSTTQLKSILTLAEGQCKSYEVNSYAQFLLKESERGDTNQKEVLQAQLTSYINNCKTMPSNDIIRFNIIENLDLISTTNNKDLAVNTLESSLDYYRKNLSSRRLEKIIESIRINEWNNASSSVENNGSATAIYQLSSSLTKLPDVNLGSIVRRLLINVIDNDESIQRIISTYGVDESIKIINSFGAQFYGDSQRRNLATDISMIAQSLIQTNLIQSEGQVADQWRRIIILKDIINNYSTNTNFAQNLRNFNSVIKNFEQFVIHSEEGKAFVTQHASTNIIAKWIQLRVFNFETKKHSPSLIDLRTYSLDEGKIESVFSARTDLYTADAKQRLNKKNNYCSTLNSFGIKPVSVSSFEQITSKVNELSGCVTYKSSTIVEKKIQATSIIFDDDLFLTLNNVNLKLISNIIDVNFVDLSTKLEHEDIIAQATPLDFNAIVIPLLLGVEDQGIYKYFSYHYVLRQNKTGPSFTVWEPQSGLNGGNLYLQQKVKNKNFSPLLISKGDLGQKATGARDGGKGVEIEFDIQSYNIPELNFANTIDQGDGYEVFNILNTKDIDNTDIKIINYLPFMKAIKDDDIKTQTKKITEQLKLASTHLETCIHSFTTACIMEEVSNSALKELKSKLIISGEDYELSNLYPVFTLDDMPQGPIPVRGNQGKDGELLLIK